MRGALAVLLQVEVVGARWCKSLAWRSHHLIAWPTPLVWAGGRPDQPQVPQLLRVSRHCLALEVVTDQAQAETPRLATILVGQAQALLLPQTVFLELGQTTRVVQQALTEPSQAMAAAVARAWALVAVRAQLLLVARAGQALICLPTGALSMATSGGLAVAVGALDPHRALVVLVAVDAETAHLA